MKFILSPNDPVFILFSLWFFTANSLSAAPKIECNAPKYDFGTITGQEKITHEFILTNTGDEPLEILKIKDCCGVKSTVDPMTIPPGSNAVCISVFTTKNRYGKQDKQILLVTNDKKNRYYDLRMTGTLLKPVEFSPRYIRLRNLMPDSAVSETITATNLLDQAVTLESASTTLKGLEAEIIESKSRSWKIQLKNSSSLVTGPFYGQIQLNFSSGLVNVPMVGTVKPIIQVVPEKIQFSARSTNATERLIMLRSGDGRSFDVLSADLERAEGSVEAEKLADDRWQLKLNIIPSNLSVASSVKIQTSSKSQLTITVPLSVR